MSQPKQKPKPEEEILDLPADREQGLASGFEDLSLADVLPMEGNSAPAEQPALSVTEEAAEAIQELVFDLGSSNPEASATAPANNEGKAFELDLGNSLLDASSQVESFSPQAQGETEEHFKFEPLDGNQAHEESAEVHEIGISPKNESPVADAPAADMAFSVDGETSSANQAVHLLGEKLFSYVACETPFEQMVEEILVILMKATNAQAGSILELDYNKHEFFFRATLGGGDPEIVKTFRVPSNKGIVGHVAESREILLLKDLNSDEKQLRAISMSTGFETRTCLAAPIIIANQIYGVVELFNKLPDECFDEEDKEILERGLKMVGKVLEVRFLLSELARRAG